MSCERGRKKAYAVDLRHRIILQRFGMELCIRSIICISVDKTCKLYKRTGGVEGQIKLDRSATRILSK